MRRKQGISLIVLVITIIVMVVLAASVVITLSNTGIIDKANKAVDKNNIKEIEQYAAMAWTEAYVAGNRTIEELQDFVDAALEKIEFDSSEYKIVATNKGVVVKKIGTYWELDTKRIYEAKVICGKQELPIGTIVNYMSEGIGEDNYTDGWKILGVDDEGRLLLSSAKLIDTKTKLYSYNLEETLKEIAIQYKDGNFAIKSRALDVDDFAKLVNYNPSNNITGEIYDHGIIVTYNWKRVESGEEPDYYPEYRYVHNGVEYTGQLTTEHPNGFRYYDMDAGEIVVVPYSAGEIIGTFETDACYFDLSSISSAYNIVKDFSGYCALQRITFRNFSHYMTSSVSHINNKGEVGGYILERSYGDSQDFPYTTKTCVVLTLADNVVLTESKVNPGTYDISFK